MNLFSKFTFIFLAVFLLFTGGSVQAAINVAIEANPNPAQPGETLNVNITVTNNGASVSGPITLRMSYPENLGRVSDGANIDGGDCPSYACDTNEQVTWMLGNLAPGAGKTVNMAPVVGRSVADDATIIFDIDVLEGGVLASTTHKTITVQSTSVFNLAVDEDANPVAPGEILTYTLNYTNRSTTSTTQTQLSLPLPDGVTFVSATGGGVLNDRLVSWNLNTVPARQLGRQQVRVRVNDALIAGTLLHINTASITGQTNFINFSAHATAITRVQGGVPLKLGIELNPDSVQPGETLNTYLTVTNTSNSVLSGVVLKLRYPENLGWVYDDANIDGGDCPSNTCDTNEQVTWVLGNLAQGAGVRVNLAPVVSRGVITGNLITFDAQVTEDNGTQVANSQTVVVQTNPVFDLAVDEDANPVAPGEILTYTLNYTNRSTTSTTQTQLSLPLPDGVTFVSATGGGVLNDRLVSWNLNTVPARQLGRQQVRVRVNDALIAGTLLHVNTASITGQTNFINFSAHATAITRVQGGVPLKLGIELNPDSVQPGETLNTDLTVTNTSNSVLSGVVLKLRYPENLGRVSDGANIDGGDCPGSTCDTNEQVTWVLGNLAAGAGIKVNLAPVVSRGVITGNLITFDAQVTEDNGTQVANSQTVVVQTNPVFDLAVDEDANPVAPGEILTYTLNYTNRSTTSTTQTQLSLPLPDGVTFVSATGGGVLNDRLVSWNLSTLPGNIGRLQRVKVRVNNATKQGSILRLKAASLKGTVNGTEHSAYATTITPVQEGAPLTLGIVLNPTPVLPNKTLNTKLTVTNTSGGILFGVTLKLRYPENLGWVYDDANIDGGDCPSNTCDTNEQVTWVLGNLAPGAVQSVNLPPIVSRNTPIGTLITFDALVEEDNGTQVYNSNTVFVGSNFTVGTENDSDNDGILDSVDPDDDNDGMPDTWENLHGLNPFNSADAHQNPDNDAFDNLQEYLAGTDPRRSDNNQPELVYIPLETPCRIVNTGGSGLVFNTTRSQQSFIAWGNTTQLNAQRDKTGNNNLGDCLPVSGLKPSALAANVTVAAKSSRAKGNVVTYPFGSSPPTASLVNFQANNIANSSIITLTPENNKHFTVKASINGFNPGGSKQANVVIDALGYFYSKAALATATNPGLGYIPLPQPCRIVNTSGGNRPFHHSSRKQQGFLAWGTPLALDGQRDADGNNNLGACLPESNMMPAAMMANFTVAAKGLKGIGNVVAFQHGSTPPTASLVNFTANNIANASIVSLNTDGTPHFDIEARIHRNNPGGSKQTHLVVDAQGYFYSQNELTAAGKTGLSYIPLTQPCRIVDTRGINKPFHFQTRKTQGFKAWGTAAQLNLQRGNSGLGACQPKTGRTPAAVMVNVTVAAKRYKSRGNVVAYPTGGALPKSSLVNFLENNIANSAILALNPDNAQHFNVTADIRGTATGGSKQADVIVDVIGYFHP